MTACAPDASPEQGSHPPVHRTLTGSGDPIISIPLAASELAAALFFRISNGAPDGTAFPRRDGITMANTKSAKKATRKIARRTEINKTRRSQMRTSMRKVEEAIAAGNRETAVAALHAAEPMIMRAAQKGMVHKHTASRKVSRLTRRIARLAQ